MDTELVIKRLLSELIVTIDPSISLRTKFGKIHQKEFAGAPVGVLTLLGAYVITSDVKKKIIEGLCESIRNTFKDKDLLEKMATLSFHYNSIDEWLVDLESILPEEET